MNFDEATWSVEYSEAVDSMAIPVYAAGTLMENCPAVTEQAMELSREAGSTPRQGCQGHSWRALLLIAGLHSACSSVCSGSDTPLQLDPAAPDASELQDLWTDFADAIAPETVCVGKVVFRDSGADGRYRRPDRQIRIASEDPAWRKTILRHELCHGWDFQVLDDKPPADLFTLSAESSDTWHVRKSVERESFAWTCSLTPSLAATMAAAQCSRSTADEGLEFIGEHVYQNRVAPTARRFERISRDLPDALFEGTPGAIIGVRPSLRVGEIQVFWIEFENEEFGRPFVLNLVDGTRATLPDEDPVLFRPPRRASSTIDDALVHVVDSARGRRIDVVLAQVELLSGWVPQVFAKVEDEEWFVPEGSCDLPADERTAFFLDEEGSLRSVSFDTDRKLHLMHWAKEG